MKDSFVKQIPVIAALILCAVTFDINTQELASDSQLPVKPALPPVEADPEVMAEKVTTALKESSGVPASDVTVATHAGTIILSGDVDTEAQRVAANAAAQKAAAGTRVSSSIEVRSPDERSPTAQAASQQSAQVVGDVEAALKADARTANLGVAVSSADGQVVVLQGLVPSRENRTAVQTIAARVKGVTRVDNRLQVPGG